jgi:hypothetical protein
MVVWLLLWSWMSVSSQEPADTIQVDTIPQLQYQDATVVQRDTLAVEQARQIHRLDALIEKKKKRK